MNDSKKLMRFDHCKNLASFEEITIIYNFDMITLKKSDGEGNFSLFQNFDTIEEVEAYLTGYCKAKGHDV